MTRALLLALCVLASVASAQHMSRLPGTHFPSDRGTRNSTTLQTSITGVGTRDYAFLMDGSWSITTNVSVPANIHLVMLPGSSFAIATNCNLEILGGFTAEEYEAKFSGPGTASGPAYFPYRIPEWGSTGLYQIGTGYLETWADARYGTDSFSTNFSYTYANGTTQSVHDLIVRNNITLPAGSIDSNDVLDAGLHWNDQDTNTWPWTYLDSRWANTSTGTLFGYPQIALSTTMVWITASAPLNAQGRQLAEMYLALDGDVSTSASNYLGNQHSEATWLDLGTQYVGYAAVLYRGITYNNNSFLIDFGYGTSTNVLTESTMDRTSESVQMVIADDGDDTGFRAHNWSIFPFAGRVVGVSAYAGAAGSGSSWLYEVRLYGSVETNMVFTPVVP